MSSSEVEKTSKEGKEPKEPKTPSAQVGTEFWIVVLYTFLLVILYFENL